MNLKEYVLKFKDLSVGKLTIYQSGEMEFRYTSEFLSSGLAPLASFPNLRKIYKNQSVLNFLMNRIPPKELKNRSHINFFNMNDLMAIGRKVSHSPIELIATPE
jgi:HipA-like protein